jgi:hypothetical protein
LGAVVVVVVGAGLAATVVVTAGLVVVVAGRVVVVVGRVVVVVTAGFVVVVVVVGGATALGRVVAVPGGGSVSGAGQVST